MATQIQSIEQQNEAADSVIANWSFVALAANLLPPPFDTIAVGSVFARMGGRLAEVYDVEMSWHVLRSIGFSVAKGVGAVATAAYIGTSLFKYVPGVNLWAALLIQPPIVAAIAYSVGHAFKRYYQIMLLEGRALTADEVRHIAEVELRQRLQQ